LGRIGKIITYKVLVGKGRWDNCIRKGIWGIWVKSGGGADLTGHYFKKDYTYSLSVYILYYYIFSDCMINITDS
jgi:hypothetical protein